MRSCPNLLVLSVSSTSQSVSGTLIKRSSQANAPTVSYPPWLYHANVVSGSILIHNTVDPKLLYISLCIFHAIFVMYLYCFLVDIVEAQYFPSKYITVGAGQVCNLLINIFDRVYIYIGRLAVILNIVNICFGLHQLMSLNRRL